MNLNKFKDCGLSRRPALFVLLASWSAINLAAQTNVLTHHNDNTRSGLNAGETLLTPSNVKSATFGKLFTLAVDGRVDAQPLYVANVTVAGVKHNVVYVATEHDSMYAFDADSGASLWHVSLLKTAETPSDDRGCGQVSPEIGITATPVINPTATPNGILYAVAMSRDGSGIYHHRLHALDITNGSEQLGGPKDIQASYPGTGDNTNGTSVIFDAKQYKERPGLLLLNGVIYTSWSSHCDIRPYTAWVMGYNSQTLAQVSVLNLTPNGNEGGVWASGAGPATDAAGNIYFLMANGTFDTTLTSGFPNKGDFGNSFVKLSTLNSTLKVADYFAMFNVTSENNVDEDLGSGGAMVLPDLVDASGKTRHLAVGAGKDANLYLVDRDNMGKFNSTSNNVYQQLPGALPGGVWAMPAYFNGKVYYGAVGDFIRAFQFTNALLSSNPVSQTATRFAYPGSTPSISANGTSNAILWAVENASTAVLHAYDAANLATELYNTNQAANSRDHFGSGNKFITPTIANGKVFIGTPSTVAVFGLLSQQGGPASITATGGTPQSATVNTLFAAALQATVKNASNNPVSGATVTFTAPASGASGTFNGSASVTAVTNSSGIATAPAFKANVIAGTYTVSATVPGVATPASFRLTNTAGAAASITAAAGTAQSAFVNTAFAVALQATVKDANNNPVSGLNVTFAAPASGASGKFSGSLTATAVTSSTGVATAPAFTANATPGSYKVTASVSGVAATAGFDLTNKATVGGTGSLAGSGNGTNTAMNLTTEGTSDWIHWGDTSLNRKAGVTAQLSNYTVVGTGTVQKYGNDPRPLNWSDGTPTASGTNNLNGVYIGIGGGFSFTAPADTSSRTLIVHVGGYSSGGTLTAHLSDKSAADFLDTTATVSGQYDRNYTLTYNAGSTGQTLTITWKLSSGAGNVTLNGAALAVKSSGPPILFQTESIPAISSGPTYEIFNWSGFTNGVGTLLYATAVGDYVTYTGNVSAAGTYDVKVGVKKFNIRGEWQLSINGTNQGSIQDEYAAAETFTEFDLGTVTISTAGSKTFKFTVVGKNAQSTGYRIAFDYIKLTPM